MKRTVLLWALALCSIVSSYGMENEVFLPAQKEMITVKFIGGQDPEKGSEIQAPKKYIELSDVLKQQLEDFEGKNICIISLDSISLNTFKQLIDLLPSVHNLSSSSESIKQQAQAILENLLKKKTDEELVLVANGADYLKIDTLIESIVQVITQRIIEHDKEYLQQYEHNTCHLKNLNPLVEEYIIKKLIALKNSLIRTLTGHKDWVQSVHFSPDGKYIVSGSNDKTIRIWGWQNNRDIQTLTGHKEWVRSVHFSPDGKYIVSGSFDNTIKIWDIQAGRCRQTLIGHQGWVGSDFSLDGKYIVSGSFDNNFFGSLYNTVKIWDAQSGQCLQTLKGYQDHWVGTTNFSPDGKYIVSGSQDGTIKIWNWQNNRCIQTLTGCQKILSIRFSPDGKYLVAGSDDKTIKIWDWRNAKCTQTLTGHQYPVASVAFSPDGTYIVSGSVDRTIKIWDWRNNSCIQTLTGHQGAVLSVHFSLDGKYIASGSDDYTIKVWHISADSIYDFLKSYQIVNQTQNKYFNYFYLGALVGGAVACMGYQWLQPR